MKEKALIGKKTKCYLSEQNMKVEGKNLYNMIQEFEKTKIEVDKIVDKMVIEFLEEIRNKEEEEIEKILREKLPKDLIESFNDNREFFILKFRRDCVYKIEYLKKSHKKSK